MPLNTRFNGSKRPDLTGILDKKALKSIMTAASQPQTTRKVSAAQSSLQNSRRSRSNRSGGVRKVSRNRSSFIEIISARRLPSEEIETTSESEDIKQEREGNDIEMIKFFKFPSFLNISSSLPFSSLPEIEEEFQSVFTWNYAYFVEKANI